MKKNIIHRLLEFSCRYSLFVILISLLITLFFGFFAVKINIDADITNLLPEDEKTGLLMEKYGQKKTIDESLIIAVESENPFSIEKLKHLSLFLNKIQNIPGIKNGITPFNFSTFEKSGSKLTILPHSPVGGAPETKEDLEIFQNRILNNPFAENLVISENEKVLCAFFPCEKLDEYSAVMKKINKAAADLKPFYNVYLSGSLPFTDKTNQYLFKDLSRLMIIAIIVMLIIYYLGFRAKRALILPLSIVIMGTVWCLGFMSLAEFSLSLVSLITPPLVLTLGSSYSIHILNQYYREHAENTYKNLLVVESIFSVTKTIIMASATTVIGLLSLLVTTMQQTKEFAVSTSFGIIACALLSLFFFPAVLSRLKPPKTYQKKLVLSGHVALFMSKLGKFVLKRRILLTVLLIVTGVTFIISLPFIKYNTDTAQYFPQKDPVIKNMQFITKNIGGFVEINVTLNAPDEEKNYFLKPDVLKQVLYLEELLKKNPDICYTTSFVNYLKNFNEIMTGNKDIPEKRGLILLLSKYIKILSSAENTKAIFRNIANTDFSRLTLSFRILNSDENIMIDEERTRSMLSFMKTTLSDNVPKGITWDVWGRSLQYLSLSNMLRKDLIRSIAVSVLLILIITSIAFKSIRLGFYSLIPLISGIMLNFIFMALFKIPLDMITVMVSSIAIGVGVDNSIHFIIQYRKQSRLHKGDINTVISNSLAITGRPILLTSLSIVGGLLVLTLASFKAIVYFGLLVIFTLSATCLGTLFILPAILSFSSTFKKSEE